MTGSDHALNAGITTVAQAVAVFLRNRDCNTAFAVAGGASLHLIHAFEETEGCRCIPMHHEQSAAMAADGFTRATGHMGVAIATSGPGATNLITGIAGCYYDSIPTIFITGQVSTTRSVGSTGVRQIGFQETPIVQMVSEITKAAFHVNNAQDIRRLMEEAVWIARTGRPGPVLIDIPDDVQRQAVEWQDLQAFVAPKQPARDLEESVNLAGELLARARRPAVIAGAGIISSGAETQFVDFVERLGAPVVLTWGALNILPKNHPLSYGSFGTHGERQANILLRNADLILSIGSRLDTKATGSPVSAFAPGAKKIMVDIDSTEIEKFRQFGLAIDCPVQADAGEFLSRMNEQLPSLDIRGWLEHCDQSREKCEHFEMSFRTGTGISPYDFSRILSETAPANLDVFVDTGCALPWLIAKFEVDRGRRLFHDFNNTAMGWSIPAAIGGAIGGSDRPSLCVIGDGSLMMGLNDLVTFSRLFPQARLVLIDNGGYSMIRQTQDQWLNSRYVASSPEGGLAFPDYSGLAASMGFKFLDAKTPSELDGCMDEFWKSTNPVILRIEIDPSWRVIPQVKFGYPNEEMEPFLPQAVMNEILISSASPAGVDVE